MSTADARMREFGAATVVPEFADPAFTSFDRSLAGATVAIVTSAALHRTSEDGFTQVDTSFRTIDRADRDLALGHWSPNFDRSGFTIDLNVVYPIDRLEELAADGVIGAGRWPEGGSHAPISRRSSQDHGGDHVAAHHYSFAGNQPDTVSELRLDTGPACAAELLADGVEVVVLTPV